MTQFQTVPKNTNPAGNPIIGDISGTPRQEEGERLPVQQVGNADLMGDLEDAKQRAKQEDLSSPRRR